MFILFIGVFSLPIVSAQSAENVQEVVVSNEALGSQTLSNNLHSNKRLSSEEEVEVPPLTEEALTERIGAVFAPTSFEVLGEGRVRLVYNFESKDEALLADWSPDLESTKRRIRWSQGYEGTFSTVEDGLVIADHGIFLHKGQWDKDVKFQVDYLSMSNSTEKDLLATVYCYDKNKRIVGSQIGAQCVRLNKSLGRSGKAIPRRLTDLLPNSQKITFGMELKNEVLTSLRGGSKRSDTAGEDKFLKNLDTGTVGLAWKGKVNGFIFKIVIEGKLDSEWLAKQDN